MNNAAPPPPPPPPVEPVRCQSRQSSAGLSAARRRLRYVLLVDRESREAALGLCECPRCAGLLELKRTLSRGPPNDEDEYSQDGEEYSDDGEELDDDGESDDDDPLMLPRPSLVRGFTEEEHYVSRATSKADRRTGSGPGSSRPKSANKVARKKEMKAKVTSERKRGLKQKGRKVETRAEERAAQLEARRENIRARVLERGTRQRTLKSRRSLPSLNVGHRATATASGTVQSRRSRPRNRPNGGHRTTAAGAVLSAAELGVEEGSMYDRLIEIMEGDDITPEDFDLLLQLDRNNVKNTMEVSQISQFEVVVIGPNEGQVPRNDLTGGCCLICLDPFEGMDDGAELRRLPCGHSYCKPCIDGWLQDHSVKCPDLSCFWAASEEEGNEEATAAATAGGDSLDVSGGAGESHAQHPPSAIDAETLNSVAERLWPVDDLEACLNRSPLEGGLSASAVLELLVDLSSQISHVPTTEMIEPLWGEVLDAEVDREEDVNADIVRLYQQFHDHVAELQRQVV